MSTGLITGGPKHFSTSKMPGQKRFMESKADWLLYSGAFAAGKSKVGCEKINFLALRYPNNFLAILRKTYASLRHTTMRTMFRDVVVEDHIDSYNKESHILRYKNGSEVLFIGLDTDTKIGSLELGGAFCDEVIEIDEDTWIMLDGRVGRLPHIPFSQLMAATNPSATTHWIYKYFFAPGGRPLNEPGREVIQANALENPYLLPEYRAKLEKFTGRYRQRYVLGQWVGSEGLVYDIEVPDIIIPRFRIPESWPRYRAVDFGYTNPFVCQWWAEVPPDSEYERIEGFDGGELLDTCPCPEEDVHPPYSAYHYSRCLNNSLKGSYMYREIYMSKRLVEHHARVIREYSKGESIIETFADWDAEGRATLDFYGVLTSPAIKRIEDGIQVCHILLNEGKVHFMEDSLVEVDQEMEEKGGMPLESASEFGVYKWMEHPQNKNNKEVPQDRDNHGMDAMRYYLDTKFGDMVLIKDTIFKTEVIAPTQRRRNPMLAESTTRDWGATRGRNWRGLGF